jgi:hypothetical protein
MEMTLQGSFEHRPLRTCGVPNSEPPTLYDLTFIALDFYVATGMKYRGMPCCATRNHCAYALDGANFSEPWVDFSCRRLRVTLRSLVLSALVVEPLIEPCAEALRFLRSC